VKFVHCSDLHLDPKVTFLSGDKLHSRKGDFLESFNRVIDYCISEDVDVLLISGDFYDRTMPSNFTRLNVFRKFLQLGEESNTKVFIIGGNHEMPRSHEMISSPIETLFALKNVHVFNSVDVFEGIVLDFNGFTVGVYGKSFNGLKNREDPLFNLPECGGDFGILMLHSSVQGMFTFYPDHSQYSPVNKKDIKQSGFDYVALGHYHKFQLEGRKPFICYSGSTERCSFDEQEGEKGFVTFEITKDGITHPKFTALPTRSLETQEITISPDVLNVNKFIIESVKDGDPDGFLKLVLTGEVYFEVYRDYSHKFVKTELEKSFFAVKIENQLSVSDTGESFDFSSLKILSPKSEFESHIMGKIKKSRDKDFKSCLKEAMELGVSWIESGGELE
jgi:DNA repair protein SbcD/Mre11